MEVAREARDNKNASGEARNNSYSSGTQAKCKVDDVMEEELPQPNVVRTRGKPE